MFDCSLTIDQWPMLVLLEVRWLWPWTPSTTRLLSHLWLTDDLYLPAGGHDRVWVIGTWWSCGPPSLHHHGRSWESFALKYAYRATLYGQLSRLIDYIYPIIIFQTLLSRFLATTFGTTRGFPWKIIHSSSEKLIKFQRAPMELIHLILMITYDIQVR